MICIHGEQVSPLGQSGIYFICQYGQYKGNHCRYSKWCAESRSYIVQTDKYGNACPDFSTEESIEQQKSMDERIQEILANPGECSKEKEPEQIVEEVIEKITEDPIEKSIIEAPVVEVVVESVKEPIEEIVEKPIKKKVKQSIKKNIELPIKKNIKEPIETSVKENIEETAEELADKIADEIINNFIKQSESNDNAEFKIKFTVGDEVKKNIKMGGDKTPPKKIKGSYHGQKN